MAPTPHVIRIERESPDPDTRYRHRCAERLSDAMRVHGLNRKELARRLRSGGNEVSLQAIGFWLNGDRLPRPSMQVAIARAIGVRPRSIFDIEDAT